MAKEHKHLLWRRIWSLKPTLYGSKRATPAMTNDNFLPFSFPAVERKKVTAAFDGGRISSDGGVMLLPKPIAGSASPIGWLG